MMPFRHDISMLIDIFDISFRLLMLFADAIISLMPLLPIICRC
jgi:hypothetical protein